MNTRSEITNRKTKATWARLSRINMGATFVPATRMKAHLISAWQRRNKSDAVHGLGVGTELGVQRDSRGNDDGPNGTRPQSQACAAEGRGARLLERKRGPVGDEVTKLLLLRRERIHTHGAAVQQKLDIAASRAIQIPRPLRLGPLRPGVVAEQQQVAAAVRQRQVVLWVTALGNIEGRMRGAL